MNLTAPSCRSLGASTRFELRVIAATKHAGSTVVQCQVSRCPAHPAPWLRLTRGAADGRPPPAVECPPLRGGYASAVPFPLVLLRDGRILVVGAFDGSMEAREPSDG